MSFLFGVLGQVQFKADSDLLRLILDYSACFREPVARRDGVTSGLMGKMWQPRDVHYLQI